MSTEDAPARRGVWRALAIVATLVTAACIVLGVHFDLIAPSVPPAGLGSASSSAIVGMAMTVPGALLLWRLGPHPIALVLTVAGILWALAGPAAGVVNLALASDDDTALASWGFWYWARFGAVLLIPIQLILLLFPDGRLATGRWRIVSVVSLVLAAILPVAYLFTPASVLGGGHPSRTTALDRFDPGLPTLPLPDPVWATLLGLAFPAAAVATVLALAVTVSRRRGATPNAGRSCAG